jgi:ribose 5-phosphate isomerase B
VRVAVASDHAGFELKQALAGRLEAAGHDVLDHGTDSTERCDYPGFAVAAASAVRDGLAARAVLCCGSGLGMAIAAGKLRGIRAITARSGWDAEMGRRHNDANVLCLGAHVTPADEAYELAELFLQTPFEGGRHAERVAQIAALDH